MDTSATAWRRDGFPDERLCVLPRPLVAEALERPVTRRLVVTDAGSFPRAAGHRRVRPTGAAEAIVIVCTAGAGWVELDGQRRGVGAGVAVVIPPRTPHAYGADERSPWSIRWAHLRGTDVVDLVAAIGSPVVSLRAVERATALLDEIVVALEQDQSPARLVATAGMAWRFMTQLAIDRRLPEEATPLERAMRHLREHLDAPVPVPELAAMVGVSPSHLTALFRHATGGGVLAHHLALRMARARSLLDTTGLPVAEVGRSVGFDDPLYFSRRFRAAHGVSPSAYRAQRKG